MSASLLPEHIAALEELLVSLFPDADSLRRLLATIPGAERLVLELPGSSVSARQLAHTAVRGLISHGLSWPAFFARLLDERPGRGDDIRQVGAQIGGAPSVPGVVGPPARSPAPELLRRFVDEPGGRRRLRVALEEQAIVGHDAAIAASLAESAGVEHFPAGTILVRQGGSDSDILLILAGQTTISVHGRDVAVRRAGQHVGEMALIDPSQARSATVTAGVETVVARVTEDAFTRLAASHPQLWRRLAVELGARLRERGALVRPRSARPSLFIGSSEAGLRRARELAAALVEERWDVRVWPDGAPGIGKGSVDSLLAQLEQLDFGALVVEPGDLAPAADLDPARDRLMVQLGLLVGALGRERTMVVRVRGVDGQPVARVEQFGVRCLELAAEVDDPATPAAVAREIRRIVRSHPTR